MAECLALERINRLLDEGSFVEVGALVSARTTDFTVNDQSAPSDGVITGYGQIEGNPVYVYSQNRDVLNGTMGEMHAKKIAKLYDMADKAAAPVIGLLDCGGFRLQESVDALDSFGCVLAKQAEYADSVLQISAVMGNCAGGMTLIPAMSDFAFMTKEAQMYVNAPHTIQDNKKLSREFDSAKYQAAVSGQAEVLESEEAVLTKIRELVVMLIDEEYGRCGEDDLNRYISDKTCAMKDARALLAECADDKFLEIRPDYAPEMVTGFLTLNGILVGAVANADALYDEKGEKTADLADGLTVDGCEKAAAFVAFCNDCEIPLLTVTAADGFAAVEQTEKGLPQAIAKLVKAYHDGGFNSKVNLIMGDTYGSAYVAMGARSISDADMVFAWDDAKVGMMEAEKAANILFAAEGEKATEKQAAAYEGKQNAVTSAAARGSVDAVIAPAQTRKHLIMAFPCCKRKEDSEDEKEYQRDCGRQSRTSGFTASGNDRICAGSRQKSPAGKCITEYSPWYGNGIRYADRNCADHLLFQDHSCNPGKICQKSRTDSRSTKDSTSCCSSCTGNG